MAEKRIVKRYATPEKMKKVNPENIKKYEKYLRSNIIKNKDVEETTYKTYESYFNAFLVFLMEKYDNIDLYSEEFFEDCIDILEDYMCFLQDELGNKKKVINTKLSAISSFYIWSTKRKFIKYHPFQGMISRMKGAAEEKIINSYFLEEDQISEITNELSRYKEKDCRYDLMDNVLWHVMLSSANRIGAIDKLKISNLNLESMCFEGIREKEGYIVDCSFDEIARDYIEEWLELRKDTMDGLSIDSMWVTKYRGEWNKTSKGTLQERVKRIGYIIGLDDFHAHCIRKTTCNRLVQSGVDIELCAELLNHKSSETSRKFYVKPKSKSDVRNEIQAKLKELADKQKEVIE